MNRAVPSMSAVSAFIRMSSPSHLACSVASAWQYTFIMRPR